VSALVRAGLIFFYTQQTQRQTQIRALNAVSLFRSRKYDDAINTFLELDINPAKIVALYPENVAGRLSVPQRQWIPLFGGPPETTEELHSRASSEEASQERSATELLDTVAASTPVNIRSKLKGLGALIPSGSGKDDDAASITSKKKSGVHGKKPLSKSEIIWKLAWLMHSQMMFIARLKLSYAI
jgi:hypothetical protein